MKFEHILAGAHKSQKRKVLEANYPQQVLEYTNQHGITEELKDTLSVRWLINSAVTDEYPLTAAPQDDTIVEAYINKWVLNDDGDIIDFYNKIVCKFFAPSNDGLRYTQHLVLATV